MKNLRKLGVLLIFMMHTGPHVLGQFPNFPDSNASWLMEVNDGPEVLYQYAYHLRATNHDTLINGTWYNTIWSGAIGQTGTYMGGLRESEDGRVWYHHANTDSTYLLYDFDPTIGDSMVVWVGDPSIEEPMTQWMYVDTVESLQNFNGTNYRQIGILSEAAVIGDQGAYHYWIEGVGGSGGLFSTIGSFSVSLEERLVCMQANDTIWPNGGLGGCWPTGVQEHNASDLKCFPNPSFGLFNLSRSQDCSLTVLDMHGREVLHLPPYSSDIDLSLHPPGIYTVLQNTGQGRSVQRLVVAP